MNGLIHLRGQMNETTAYARSAASDQTYYLFKSELLCLFHCVLNIGSQMLLPMAVTSDRQDPPAELSIQAQNIDRRRQVLKSIAMTGGIDLYALAVRNDRFQDFRDDGLDFLERIIAGVVIPGDQIQVSQDTAKNRPLR